MNPNPQINTSDTLKLVEKAEQLTKENQLAEAIICYQKLFENEPNQPIDIYLKLGNALINSNRLEEAETVFQELKDKYPHSIHGYNGLALIAQKKRIWKLALSKWDELLAKFPQHIWGYITHIPHLI